MTRKDLNIRKINCAIEGFNTTKNITPPSTGWIKAIRTAIGMSMRQLGTKLEITKQSVQDIERREQEGSITLKSLREAAYAMDMELVYGLIPKDGSLDKMIDRKARELATKIVMRSADGVESEGRDHPDKTIKGAVEKKALSIKNEIPKSLWD